MRDRRHSASRRPRLDDSVDPTWGTILAPSVEENRVTTSMETKNRMMGKIKSLWEREAVPTCKLCGARVEHAERPCPDCGYLAGTESNVFYIPERGMAIRSAAPSEAAEDRPDPDSEDGTGSDLGFEREDEVHSAPPVQPRPKGHTPSSPSTPPASGSS